MRGQFQLSKRAPHPPLRGTFSPWEKGQTTPSFLTFRFRATAFQNRLTGQRCPLWPPGFASQRVCRFGAQNANHPTHILQSSVNLVTPVSFATVANAPTQPHNLPIEELRDSFEQALQESGRIVVSASTGSGKSTRVPVWCMELGHRVLVVEPRRVACRSLARFVAQQLQKTLGDEVGYAVRHEKVFSSSSRLVYATPGTVLRMIQDSRSEDLLSNWGVFVLDEFHERQIDVDLLLALAEARRSKPFVIMSATLELTRLARHVQATALQGEGQMFPVTVDYAEQPPLPSEQNLDQRIVEAVDSNLKRPGDVLVFLPGKGEIGSAAAALRRLAQTQDLDVLPLHGSLSAKDQDRAFTKSGRRRIVLATNVAETSVTLPDIGVVIDSGLVRQTRYHWGSGVLQLVPIASDSAEQRRGRAGRLAPGHCLRLWNRNGVLSSRTQPEMLREDLTDAALIAAACGARLRDLRFLDPPPPYAIDSALNELKRLDCLDEDGEITEAGRSVNQFPLPARQGRFLVAAKRLAESSRSLALLDDAIDLVGSLASGRRLFLPSEGVLSDERKTWTDHRCDATANILAIRQGRANRDGLNSWALAEGRRVAKQLRRMLKTCDGENGRSVDRVGLTEAWVEADPKSLFVRRKRREAFSNEGTEVQLARESLLAPDGEALVLVQMHRLKDRRRVVNLATCAIPTTLVSVAKARLGKLKVFDARVKQGQIICKVRRVYAGRSIREWEEIPEGEVARQALLDCVTSGRVLPKAYDRARELIASWNLFRRLKQLTSQPAVDAESWLAQRVDSLGFETGADLELLDEGDFEYQPPESFDAVEQHRLQREYPFKLAASEAFYEVDYDLNKRVVTLVWQSGQRRRLPRVDFLPSWPGWRIQVRRASNVTVLRS